MALFTEAQKREIEARVAAAEKRTSAEFVVACIAQSDGYAAARLFFATLVALCGSAALSLALPWLHTGEILGLQWLLGAVAFFASRYGALLRWVAPAAIKRAAVERAAQLAFTQHSVFATRERTGVLILLSELERQVAILGDEGIHARVKAEGWQQHVATIVKAIHDGKPAEGVSQVIDALAHVLADAAPVRADDTNELPNRVRD